MLRLPHTSTLFPYTTLFRSRTRSLGANAEQRGIPRPRTRSFCLVGGPAREEVVNVAGSVERSHRDRKSTSELQSHSDLVCRLLLEKKKKQTSKYKFTLLFAA